MKADKVFAFGAANLQVALLVHFFGAYAHKVFIEGVTADDKHLGAMLSHAMFMGRHTDVIVFSRDGETLCSAAADGSVYMKRVCAVLQH